MNDSAVLSAVRAAEAARAEAMAAGDLDALAALLHPDLRYGHTSGRWDTRDEYLTKLSDGSLAYPRLTSTVTGSAESADQVLLWVEIDADVITPSGARVMHNASLIVWDVTGPTPLMRAHQPTVLA